MADCIAEERTEFRYPYVAFINCYRFIPLPEDVCKRLSVRISAADRWDWIQGQPLQGDPSNMRHFVFIVWSDAQMIVRGVPTMEKFEWMKQVTPFTWKISAICMTAAVKKERSTSVLD